MEITEVRIKLMEEAGERLQAFCSITFDDCFVIRDLKIIEGSSGPFVAMPSRKLTSHCHGCRSKNHLRAAYCNHCGARLKDDRAVKDEDGRAKLYADIAHPINSACREMIQERVVREFYCELDRAKQPGYVSRYDDIDLDDVTIHMHGSHSGSVPAAHHRPHPAREASGPASASPREAANRPSAPPRPSTHERTTQERTTIQVQPGEHQPRGPHHGPSARNGVNAAVNASAATVGSATQRATQPTPARPAASPAATPSPAPSSPATPTIAPSGKPDEFGAGIF